MGVIRNNEDLNNDLNYGEGNKIIGCKPTLKNSVISFEGKNNILFVESPCLLVGCTIRFKGNNSILFLSETKFNYQINLKIHSNSTIYFGKHNHFSESLNAIVSEEKNIFIGNYCLFSRDIWFRNADAHLIYSSKDDKRINYSKSIYLGDHVWVGQKTIILKGTQIDSGSIIGAASLVSGKKIPHNSIFAGNPVKLVREDIFWDRACTHKFTGGKTKASRDYNLFKEKYQVDSDINCPDNWKYEYVAEETIAFEDIEKQISGSDADSILNYLKTLSKNDSKNRFVHAL